LTWETRTGRNFHCEILAAPRPRIAAAAVPGCGERNEAMNRQESAAESFFACLMSFVFIGALWLILGILAGK